MHSGLPLAHGYAVAFGMVAEARLSHRKTGLPQDAVDEISETVNRLYGPAPETMKNADALLEWMRFDKKNRGNRINFTLLEEIGKCAINIEAGEEEIREVLGSRR